MAEFNAAVNDAPFDPAIKDGKGTEGIDPPKSNWAQPLDEPPFTAFPAAGELVGGIFFHNYPGGTGLMSGAVFGRRAGAAASQPVIAGPPRGVHRACPRGRRP